MAAPRSTSLRALRNLAQQQHAPAPSSSVSRRSLHITGANSAQPVAGTDILSIYRSRSLSDLKRECERRSLTSSGSKAEVGRIRSFSFWDLWFLTDGFGFPSSPIALQTMTICKPERSALQ